MKIKISRSFSQKKQIAQYEPIESFCGAEAEVEVVDLGNAAGISGLVAVSTELDRICRAEVEKTLKSVAASLKEVDRKKSKDVGRNSAELEVGDDD